MRVLGVIILFLSGLGTLVCGFTFLDGNPWCLVFVFVGCPVTGIALSLVIDKESPFYRTENNAMISQLEVLVSQMRVSAEPAPPTEPPRLSWDETARQLAQEVLDTGERAAVMALMDRLQEAE